jgi:hypothetical protein
VGLRSSTVAVLAIVAPLTLFPFGSLHAENVATIVAGHAYGFASLSDAKRFATLIFVEKDIAAGQAFARQRNVTGQVKEFRKGASVIVEERAPGPIPGVDGEDWRCARTRGEPTCYWAPRYFIFGEDR